eukprot:9108-Heterococcus_DN1.PRE.2
MKAVLGAKQSAANVSKSSCRNFMVVQVIVKAKAGAPTHHAVWSNAPRDEGPLTTGSYSIFPLRPAAISMCCDAYTHIAA